MDYAEILTRLQDATSEELNSALAAVAAKAGEYQGAATTDSAKAVTELAAAARQLRGELDARLARDAEQAAQLAELTQLTTVAPESPAVDNTQDAPAQPDASAPADDPKPTGAADTNTPEGGAPVVAATRKLGGQLRVDGSTTAPTLPTARVRPTALDPVFGQGTELNRRTIAEGFARKLSDLDGGPAVGRVNLLQYRTEFPEERMLRRHDNAFSNLEKVGRVTEAASAIHARDAALVAAGFCAPFEVLYDIPVLGETDRPVRAALSRFGAERGGITYRPALDGVTQTGGIGVWTEAQDEADPLVPKTCFEIVCPGILTASVEAVYLCLQFPNMSTRFDPESMDAAIRAQQIAHARFAENRLLTQLTAGSKALTTIRQMGATRDILVTLDKVTAYYRNVHRLTDASSLRAILPLWARNLMRADIARQMVGDGLIALAITDAMIDDWFRERNISITWHLDGINPADLTTPEPDVVTAAQFYTLAAAQSAVPGFPADVQMLLWAEGDWLLLDGGELNLGLVRDSTLNSENRFQTFSEAWEMPVNRGVEPLVVYMAVEPTGQSAATVNTAAFND